MKSKSILKIVGSFFLTTFVIRLVFTFVFQLKHFVDNPFFVFVKGLASDWIVYLSFALTVVVLHVLFKNRVAKLLSLLLGLIIILFSCAQNVYFIETLSFFTLDLWAMIQDKAGDVLNDYFHWSNYFLLVIVLPILFVLGVKLRSRFYLWFIPIFLLTSLFQFKNFSFYEHENNFSQNACLSFYKGSLNEFGVRSDSLGNMFSSYYKDNGISTDYPLLYADSMDGNLSSFFIKRDSLPNVVFIVVEGLGNCFGQELSGDLTFTPFLDSLSQASLYFPNCFSTAERTFAALPSVLGSLPHGRRGFAEEYNFFPKHNSLPRNLANVGYRTTFFYGGDSGFDRMKQFLEYAGISEIIDENQTLLNEKTKLNDLGVNDSLLFAFNSEYKSTPFFDLYLTLSMHYPFVFENQDTYRNKVRTRIQETGTTEQKEFYSNYIDELSTVLFTDNCLRRYFEEAMKKKWFNNTIFVITGDHMLPEIPQRNQLVKFNVPLIIYSPLIKRNKRINGLNSHLHISPGILKLLKFNFGMQLPDSLGGLEQDLDTNESLVFDKQVLFMMNDRKHFSYLHDSLFEQDGRLFKVKGVNELSLTDMQSDILNQKNSLIEFHRYLAVANKIVPCRNMKDVNFRAVKEIEFQDEEFVGLYDYPLQKDEEFLRLEIFMEHNDEFEDLSLVVTVENELLKKYEAYALKDISFFNGNNYIVKLTLDFSEVGGVNLNKGDRIKAYFYNPSKTKYNSEIKNIKLKLSSS